MPCWLPLIANAFLVSLFWRQELSMFSRRDLMGTAQGLISSISLRQTGPLFRLAAAVWLRGARANRDGCHTARTPCTGDESGPT